VCVGDRPLHSAPELGTGQVTGSVPVVVMSKALRRGDRVSYLSCPSCGLTLFDRNPLTSPRHCPRCARRARSVDLEPVASLRGRPPAVHLRGEEPETVEGVEQAGR
jgi:uncharacterized Zn finger protein (UPF0148 family)